MPMADHRRYKTRFYYLRTILASQSIRFASSDHFWVRKSKNRSLWLSYVYSDDITAVRRPARRVEALRGWQRRDFAAVKIEEKDSAGTVEAAVIHLEKNH